MFELTLKNLKTGKIFIKKFYSEWAKKDFVRKCRHGNKLEIIQELYYSF